MELVELITLTVNISDVKDKICVVKIPPNKKGRVKAGEVHKLVCQQLGLQKNSWKFFTLVLGDVYPVSKCRETDILETPIPDLRLEKWLFDTKVEQREILNDPAAINLLYLLSQQDIQSGKLVPTAEQKEKLDEYNDTEFVQEQQFVRLCHQLPHYTSVLTRGNVNTFSPIPRLENGDQVAVKFGRRGIYIDTDEDHYSCAWCRVKSWSSDKNATWVEFVIELDNGSTCPLKLTSPQVSYILSVIMEMLRYIQIEKGEMCFFSTDMIHRYPMYTQWDNVVYDPDYKLEVENEVTDMCSVTHFVCDSP